MEFQSETTAAILRREGREGAAARKNLQTRCANGHKEESMVEFEATLRYGSEHDGTKPRRRQIICLIQHILYLDTSEQGNRHFIHVRDEDEDGPAWELDETNFQKVRAAMQDWAAWHSGE